MTQPLLIPMMMKNEDEMDYLSESSGSELIDSSLVK